MRSNRISICHFGLITLAIFLLAGGARAQTPSASPSPSPKSLSSSTLEKDFFKNILRDQKAIWMAPFHLHGRDARYLAPLGLGAAALIATDQRTGDEIAESTRPLNASRIISHAGSVYGVGAGAATRSFGGRGGRNHYLSDVLVGSALGYGIGRYVYHTHHRKSSDAGGNEEEESFSRSKKLPAIEPLYNRRAHDYGVGLTWSF